MKVMNTRAKSMSGKGLRLCLACEKRKNRIGDFASHRRGQLFARGPADSGQAAKLGEQRAAAPWTNARNVVERGMQIAHRTRFAVERDREPMGLVANLLQQQQRRVVLGERNRLIAIAREEQL